MQHGLSAQPYAWDSTPAALHGCQRHCSVVQECQSRRAPRNPCQHDHGLEAMSQYCRIHWLKLLCECFYLPAYDSFGYAHQNCKLLHADGNNLILFVSRQSASHHDVHVLDYAGLHCDVKVMLDRHVSALPSLVQPCIISYCSTPVVLPESV